MAHSVTLNWQNALQSKSTLPHMLGTGAPTNTRSRAHVQANPHMLYVSHYTFRPPWQHDNRCTLMPHFIIT